MVSTTCGLVLAVLLLVGPQSGPRTAHGQTVPNFCTYIEDHVYECDYASMVSSSDRPIEYDDFDDEPQKLDVTVNGFLPFFGESNVFSSGFNTIDQSQFDPNSPAELNIDCGWAGSVYMSTGAFGNMSYVQHLSFRNCETYYIPAYAFQELVDLDSFSFSGGSIDDVDPNAMAGLNVEKLTTATHSIPRNLGRFEILYSRFANKYVPPGLLFNWKNLTSASIVGADLDNIGADVFTYNTKLRYVDISDNTFTNIPGGIFSGLLSLSDVRIFNIDWTCDCDQLWWVEYTVINNITMFGDFMCSNVAGTSVKKYYYDTCITNDVCEGTIGVAMMNKCMTMIAMIAFSCAFISLVCAIVGLVLIICARKAHGQKKTRRVKARGRWNKVLDVNVKSKMKK